MWVKEPGAQEAIETVGLCPWDGSEKGHNVSHIRISVDSIAAKRMDFSGQIQFLGFKEKFRGFQPKCRKNVN